MSQIEDLQSIAGLALKLAAELGAQPVPSSFDVNDKRTWWPAMLEQAANNAKPHGWVDWQSGMEPGASGDNDKPDEEFLRAYTPFMNAATRGGWKDSTGAVFFLPNVKKRADELAGGPGAQSWAIVRLEVKRLVNSDQGKAWLSDPLNAAFLPKLDL